jgi:hypothetical protein
MFVGTLLCRPIPLATRLYRGHDEGSTPARLLIGRRECRANFDDNRDLHGSKRANFQAGVTG